MIQKFDLETLQRILEKVSLNAIHQYCFEEGMKKVEEAEDLAYVKSILPQIQDALDELFTDNLIIPRSAFRSE